MKKKEEIKLLKREIVDLKDKLMTNIAGNHIRKHREVNKGIDKLIENNPNFKKGVIRCKDSDNNVNIGGGERVMTAKIRAKDHSFCNGLDLSGTSANEVKSITKKVTDLEKPPKDFPNPDKFYYFVTSFDLAYPHIVYGSFIKNKNSERKPVIDAAVLLADCINEEVETQRDALLKEKDELIQVIIKLEKQLLNPLNKK